MCSLKEDEGISRQQAGSYGYRFVWTSLLEQTGWAGGHGMAAGLGMGAGVDASAAPGAQHMGGWLCVQQLLAAGCHSCQCPRWGERRGVEDRHATTGCPASRSTGVQQQRLYIAQGVLCAWIATAGQQEP